MFFVLLLFFGFEESIEQQGLFALFSLRMVNSSAKKKKNTCLILRSQHALMGHPSPDKRTHFHRLCAARLSVELIVDAEMWPGDVIRVQED